jgi:hypothetical protein
MFKNFLLCIGYFGKFNLVSPFISFACPKETKQRKGQPVQSSPAQAIRAPRWTGTPTRKDFFINDL